MSLDALQAGLGDDWPFETFPQYLDALEKRGSAINVAALFGHTPLRLYVMGEEFDRARRHARRDRRDEEADARGDGGRRDRLRHLGVGQPQRLCRQAGAEPPGHRRGDGRAGLGDGRPEARPDADHHRPRILDPAHGRGQPQVRRARHLDRPALLPLRTGRPSQAARPRRRAAQVGRDGDPAGELPAAQFRVHLRRAVHLRRDEVHERARGRGCQGARRAPPRLCRSGVAREAAQRGDAALPALVGPRGHRLGALGTRNSRRCRWPRPPPSSARIRSTSRSIWRSPTTCRRASAWP